MTNKTHQEMLEKYAEAIVKVGLNIRAGQRLIINLRSIAVSPSVCSVGSRSGKAAYGVGAKYVEVIWGDEEMLRLRAQYAPRLL